MPRELITIQIGQCGNQIGCRFWDLALQEHAKQKSLTNAKEAIYDEALSTFFRNVDTNYTDCPNLPYDPKKPAPISGLKARAILVDMEQGVLNSLLNGSLGELFDSKHFLSDVSGSGNNWAHGHEGYGPQYKDDLLERIRNAVEMCDSLQSFFLMHSLGGGTGSGLGTYILQLLADEYPDVYRFVTPVFPSKDDDVITSPYNAVLATNELIEYADCVLPLENQSLFDLVAKVDQITGKQRFYNNNSNNPDGAQFDQMGNITANNAASKTNAALGKNAGKILAKAASSDEKPFDQMNNIAAHLLTNLTCSMRFEGHLNVDLNEITMNLVPYPRLHFLCSSLAPLVLPKDVHLPPRRVDQMFSDVFQKDYQLMKCDPKHHKYLACGLIVRGNIQISDLNRNIGKIKQEIDMIYWNQEGFKLGLCTVPPVNQPYSLLCLSNNCCLAETFCEMKERFNKLYKKQLYTHHYLEYMDGALFKEAEENLTDLVGEYEKLANSQAPDVIPRFIPDL